MLLKVNATFTDKKAQKLDHIEGLEAKLFDKDLVGADFLSAAPIQNGQVEFIFESSKMGPFESQPDLFITLFKNGSEVFRTKIQADINMMAMDELTESRKQSTIDLGTFEVDFA